MTTATDTPGDTGTDNKDIDVLGQISDVVKQAVTPLGDKVAELESQLAELKKPVDQGSKRTQLMGGGGPAVRKGEDVMSSRGYRLSRVFQAIRDRNFDNCKIELDIHKRLHQAYGTVSGEGETFLVPMGGAHLHYMDDDDASEIRQLMRQGVAGADLGEMNHRRVNQDLSIYDDTAGAALLGSVQQGELIDLLRSRELFTRAGAREFTFPPNGRIQWPRHTGATTAYWVGENEAITASEFATGMLSMAAKKLASLVTVPNELLRFSTATTEALIRMDMADSMANKLDVTLLEAVGSEVTPKGLIHYDNLQTHTAANTGTNGDTLFPEDVAMLVAKIEAADIPTDNVTLFIHPLLMAGAAYRRADAVSASDQAGPYLLFRINRTQDGGDIEGYRALKSSHMPTNRTKGSGTNLTMLIAGVFSQYLIGRHGVIEFAMNGNSNTNFTQDLTSLRAIQHVDGKPRREEAFGYIDNLLNS